MKYHFFIPDLNDGIIHWSDTLKEFQDIVRIKREAGKYRCFSDAEDVRCRVLNPATMQADDYYLSELMSSGKLDI